MNPELLTGVTLTYKSSPELVIGGLTNIGDMEIKREDIDITTLADNGFRKFMPGIADGGEVSIEGFVLDESNYSKIRDLLAVKTTEDFVVEFEGGAKLTIPGYLNTFKDTALDVGGVRKFAGSIKVSGEPTYTEAVVSA